MQRDEKAKKEMHWQTTPSRVKVRTKVKVVHQILSRLVKDDVLGEYKLACSILSSWLIWSLLQLEDTPASLTLSVEPDKGIKFARSQKRFRYADFKLTLASQYPEITVLTCLAKELLLFSHNDGCSCPTSEHCRRTTSPSTRQSCFFSGYNKC